MKDEFQQQLQEISDKLEVLNNTPDEEGASNIYASTHLDGYGNLVLSANAEGLLHFASILVSLALESKDQQHYHFDINTVLSVCEKPIILKFEHAPWETNK